MDAWDMFDLILDVLELVAHLVVRVKSIFEDEERKSIPRVIFEIACILGFIALVYYGIYIWLT